MNHAEYAVSSDAPEHVARAIAPIGLSFAAHSSAYWGPYLLHSGQSEEVRVYLNSDPMFDAQSDPPDERYFKVEYKKHGVLVDAMLEQEKQGALLAVLRNTFPGSERIK